MKTPTWCIRNLGTIVLCGLACHGVAGVGVAQSLSTLRVSTLAGGGPYHADGTGESAGFVEPTGIAVDKFGNVYVSDSDRDNGFGNTIRKITPGGEVTTFAGSRSLSGSQDGATFNTPEGLALDGAGNLYVADSHNHGIRKITPDGFVTTLATGFFFPMGVAVDGSGNVYVTDTYSHVVRKITPDRVVSVLAGAVGSAGSADGVSEAARFRYPQGIAVDGAGNIFVADSGNSTVRKISPGGVVTTLAGAAGVAGNADGVGNAARFAQNGPTGLAVDGEGNIYLADTLNHTVRKLAPSGEVTTVAGVAGGRGAASGAGDAARFFLPVGLAVDRVGNVYIADMGSDTIRLAVPLAAPTILMHPTPQTVASGSSVVFTLSARGSPLPTYQWIRDGEIMAGATNATLVIARATAADAGNYTCVVTNSSGTVTSSAATLGVVATTNPGRLVNLSVRANAGSGSQTLTVGFTLGGTGTSGSGNLLIRAAGPTLSGLGAAPVLADPVLTVFQGDAVVASNDNWGTPVSNQAAVLAATHVTGAFPFSSVLSADAALVTNLPAVAGGYVAQITGGETGIALAEVYDYAATRTPATPRLVNLSARGQVGPATGELIVGLVIGGTTSKTVLVRALGPALAAFGVTAALPDPRLALHATLDGRDVTLATNVGWGGDAQISAIGSSVGAFPLTNGFSGDSAVVVSLAPGAYTVQVSSDTGAQSGLVLAEIYEVP